MGVGGGVDDGAEEKGVLEKPLYGLDEEGREIPGVGEGGCECAGVRQVGRERGRGGERIEVGKGGWVTGDVRLVGRLEGWDLGANRRVRRKTRGGGVLTISRNSAPTLSSPLPPSSAPPRASSKRSTKWSENMARSPILPNMMWTSSRVMGGPSCEDAVEESEAVETVLDDELEPEPGEKGGGLGVPLVLNGVGWPAMQGAGQRVSADGHKGGPA